MRTLTTLIAGLILAAGTAIAIPASAAPAREFSCGPPLHASGTISIAYAGAHAMPRHLSISAMVGWLFACNNGKATWRARQYLDGGNLDAPMPAGMWYWTIEGQGGLP
jgi:hypothetical protein